MYHLPLRASAENKLWMQMMNLTTLSLTLYKLQEQICVNLVFFRFYRQSDLHFSWGLCQGTIQTQLEQQAAETASHTPEPDCKTKPSVLCSSPDCWFPTKWAVLIGSLGSNKLAHLSVQKRGLLLSYRTQSTWENSLVKFLLFCNMASVNKSVLWMFAQLRIYHHYVYRVICKDPVSKDLPDATLLAPYV